MHVNNIVWSVERLTLCGFGNSADPKQILITQQKKENTMATKKIRLENDELFINDDKIVLKKRSEKIFELQNEETHFVLDNKEIFHLLKENPGCIPLKFQKPENNEEAYLIFLQAGSSLDEIPFLHFRSEPYPGLWREGCLNLKNQQVPGLVIN